MLLLKRVAIMTISVVALLVFAACGSSPTTTTASTPTTAPAAPTTAPTAAATTPASTGGAIIKTATATVKGASKTVLTDVQGKTLYYFTPDTATTSACTGGCATNWPSLLFTGSGQPTASGTLPGTLTVVATANGQQVAYNGHLLYTFAADAAPGDTKGEGIGGKWFVATTDLKAM
ncbi:MAG: hypothetical protein M3Y81_27600 [Chloroflexota bacterium]|nr:hypothetical protein [Chloroflexota bacterium]